MRGIGVYNTLNSKAGVRAIDKFFCLSIALMPLFRVYNFPVLNISAGTVLLFLLLPCALMKVYTRREKKDQACLWLLIMLFFYLSCRSEGNVKKILLNVPAFFILWAILKGAVNERQLRKYVEYFACVNAVIIVIQTACHYLLEVNLSFVAYSLLQRDYFQTYGNLAVGAGLYRPSGLLLEPAFFAQYGLFALISCLFPRRGSVKVRRAIVIGMGIVCSTSGMGIVLMGFVIAWALFLNRDSKQVKLKRLVVAGACALVALLVLCMLPFFRQALQRVFSNVDGYNALKGRTGHWGTALNSMKFTELMIGLGGDHTFKFYLSGLPETVYQYGWIGVALLLSIFVWMMLKKRNQYVWCSCVVFFILFCVAKLTGVFSQLFYYSIIMVNAVSTKDGNVGKRKGKQKMEPVDYSGMTEITDQEIKQISLDILTDVKNYCQANGLRYYLVCGTALGAIRHNGFIPWDDDVDIAMPRPDYEKFLAKYQAEQYYLVDPRSGENYPYAFAKVCDKRTTLVEKITNPFPLGVYIDVFPIDGIPSDPKEQKKHLRKIDWDLRLISWKRISKEKKLDVVHKIIQIIAKTVLAPIPISVFIQKLNRDLKSVRYSTSEYVGHLATKSYWGDDRKPKAVFEPPAEHVFEDQEFCVPGDYDAYLTLEYGDYMKLPPVEKQVSHHDYVAYWKQA